MQHLPCPPSLSTDVLMAKVMKKPLQCFAFLGYHWPSTVLQTEILPYLAITDVPLKTPGKKLLTNTFTHIANVNLIFKTNMFFFLFILGQISFLQVISNFTKSKSPFR